MTPPFLTTLIELAQNELDAATQRLGRAQRERSEAETQFDALVQYRNEYYARFSSAARAGLPAGNMRNFQAFIDTLDAAIEQQRKLVEAAAARLDAARPDWQRHKQKLGSYEVLRARGAAAEATQTARREQRDADEYAARALRRRADSQQEEH